MSPRLRSGAEDVRRLTEQAPHVRDVLAGALSSRRETTLRNAAQFTVEWLDELRRALYFDHEQRDRYNPHKRKRPK